VVLTGGSLTYTTPATDMNSLGDVPLERRAARLLRTNGTPNERKTLLVFVTPTVIDAAGNRVNPPDKMPFRQNGIPRQKPSPGGPRFLTALLRQFSHERTHRGPSIAHRSSLPLQSGQ
jgi:hypothetical protein